MGYTPPPTLAAHLTVSEEGTFLTSFFLTKATSVFLRLKWAKLATYVIMLPLTFFNHLDPFGSLLNLPSTLVLFYFL